MRKIILLVSAMILRVEVFAQEIPVNLQQQLEDQAERSAERLEDDAWLQQMETFSRHKLNINRADADDLRRLGILNELQLRSFLSYRKLLGEFISLYELQAVPGWDAALLRKLFPFLTVTTVISNREQLFSRLRKGDHQLLIRSSMDLKRSKGFIPDSAGRAYSGSPQHLFFRLRYQYNDLLQWGISGEKDAGEPFFKKSNRLGFDHYSFHFFLRKMGVIRSLALGDFTVNMGQGLIQWQSMAFKRSADVMNCKRQSEIIRPYNSSGEFYFNRGAAVTLNRRKWSLTGFASFRKLDANRYPDSLSGGYFVNSFQTSGYHRTDTENENRKALQQFFYGGNLTYENGAWRSGVNAVAYLFSLPFKRSGDAYDRFAIEGKTWSNFSMDMAYTWKNLHWFAEMAMDARLNRALLSGCLISLDRKADLSVLWRNISAGYQTINGNAFTESGFPTNEKGIYLGLTFRPRTDWRIDVYADVYSFPWLRYRVNAPSYGRDLLIQVVYTPDKLTEIYGRSRFRQKQMNRGDGNYYSTLSVPQQNFRLHISRKISNDITIRQRMEYVHYDKKGSDAQQGFLFFVDLLYRPSLKPLNLSCRWQYFESTGYDAAVYAYENDVLYSFSIPGLSGKGKRYYVLAGYELDRKTSCWFRLAATVYEGVDHIGDSNDRIRGNKRLDYHFQLRFLF